MERAKDPEQFGFWLESPLPGRDIRARQIDADDLAADTDSLRSMAAWASAVKGGG